MNPFRKGKLSQIFPSAFRLRLRADTGKRCFLTFSECAVSVRFTYFFRKTVSPFFLPPAFHADSTTSAKDSTHAVLLDPLYGTFLIAAVVLVVSRRQARCQGDVALHCTQLYVDSGSRVLVVGCESIGALEALFVVLQVATVESIISAIEIRFDGSFLFSPLGIGDVSLRNLVSGSVVEEVPFRC